MSGEGHEAEPNGTDFTFDFAEDVQHLGEARLPMERTRTNFETKYDTFFGRFNTAVEFGLDQPVQPIEEIYRDPESFMVITTEAPDQNGDPVDHKLEIGITGLADASLRHLVSGSEKSMVMVTLGTDGQPTASYADPEDFSPEPTQIGGSFMRGDGKTPVLPGRVKRIVRVFHEASLPVDGQ